MSEMIERVAKAIQYEREKVVAEVLYSKIPYSDGGERVSQRLAHAAIEAMREPTADMIYAGTGICEGYREMIDAALSK